MLYQIKSIKTIKKHLVIAKKKKGKNKLVIKRNENG